MKTNYHTHSIFCDGKVEPETLVLEAIEKQFSVLGFSSHGIYPYQSYWHLKTNQYEKYCSTINALREKYAERIEILLGFEADYLPLVSEPDKNRYRQFNPDYLIGSIHYVINMDDPQVKGFPQKDSDIPVNCFAIDGPVEEVEYGLKTMFNGDKKKAVQNYFALEREMISSFDFDIVGHPDILRKRNSVLDIVDVNEQWYKDELMETARTIARSGKVCEINFGGIARGTSSDTYPSLEFLKMLKSCNVPVTINSDAHDRFQLDKGLDFAVLQAEKAGYGEIWYLQKGRWMSIGCGAHPASCNQCT